MNKSVLVREFQRREEAREQNRDQLHEEEGNPLASVVKRLLQYQNLFRIYHWQTRSYARHKASDELVSSLGDLADRLVEGLQGANNQRVTFGRQVHSKLTDVDDREATQLVLNFKRWLSDLHQIVEFDSGISNTRDEIIALLDKTLYLFTFE